MIQQALMDTRLGGILSQLLHTLASTDPELIKGLGIEVQSQHWQPTEHELSVIDNAIRLAASQRGWQSEVRSQPFESVQTYIAKLRLGSHLIESECCNITIARLQTYVAASRGEY